MVQPRLSDANKLSHSDSAINQQTLYQRLCAKWNNTEWTTSLAFSVHHFQRLPGFSIREYPHLWTIPRSASVFSR